MNIKRPILILFVLPVILFLSSCTGSEQGYMTNKRSNFFGIMKYDQGSFRPPGYGAVIRTNEIMDRRNISGDKVTLFWGLIEIQDY